MACGSHFETGNCVCDILRQIADAQSDVVTNECTTSCEQSINDLLGGTLPAANDLDTVPVILYCDCEPFKGFGAPTGTTGDLGSFGNVVGSFFFRVKSVDDNCCTVLELLRDPNDNNDNPDSPADQSTDNLEATGICITVNVNCFCHITCLPAISAL
ncbi:CotY/CotZ family spore coat protein [Aquibacillus sp. 3ASR75-11]|uniref:CotY/CotZ family spore coat protein n=1 Tax=Terrihalobacillus insolitus TaxID=2950438 RepID=A0A9X3WY61_9BACI|nr:CotY/CotZ family spore coat protein [Terrihalobacillus insolitus]MDC3413661.1 CotY/CotZ family spore coat protein [Terrihalobacillus insolitus]MDC3425464.1 CotY/CotZ family spore coat protein [Terrihalobacillus insolitus]